jgi:hypothetical protein
MVEGSSLTEGCPAVKQQTHIGRLHIRGPAPGL